MEKRLKKLSGENIELLGRVAEEKLYELYAKAKGFIALARDEDFGMTPVEAQAAGTPVIAFNGGGFKESVIDSSAGSGQVATGILIDDTDEETLRRAIESFNKVKWDKEKIQNQARKFSKERFKKEIKKFPYDKEKSRESRLKTFFGLSVEEYNKMLHSQNYSCSICRVPAKNFTQSLAVDHNHDTNQIRGLLCTRCNVLLGYAHESTELLQSAIDYLIYWGGINA